MGRALLNKALIELFADGWGCALSLLSGLRWLNPGVYRLYGRVSGDLQEDLFQGAPCRTAAVSPLIPVASHCWPTPPQETLQHQHLGLVQSSVGSLLLSPGSWCMQDLVCVLQEWSLFPPVPWKSYNQILLAFKVRLPGDSQSLCWTPGWEAWCGAQNLHNSEWTSLVLLFSSLWVTQFNSAQSLSCVQLFVIPWTAACQACLSITNSWSLLKLVSIELVMPLNHLILCCSLLFLPSIFPSIRIFSNESVLRIKWPKYWSFSFSINPSNEYSGLISFRIDSWVSLQSKGLWRGFSNTTVQKHQFFSTQLSL